MESKIKSLLKHVQQVTFAELLTTLSLAMLLVSIVMLYEARTAILQRYIVPNANTSTIASHPSLELSASSISKLQQFILNHNEIAVLEVVGVRLIDNQRTTLIRLFNDHELERATSGALDTPTMLFSSDMVYNAEISALLNGEFTCTSSDHGPFVTKHNLRRIIKTTCRIPVPPYYGKLTGYLVLHATRELSIYEIDALRPDAIKLAFAIYYADIARPLNASGGLLLHD